MCLFSSSQIILQILSVLPYLAISVRPPLSPCPNIFGYERAHSTGDIIFPGKDQLFWRGVVRVPGRVLVTGKAVHLRVLLAVPTTLPTKYVGRIEFPGDRDKLVEGSLDPVVYDVIFPSNTPIPHLLQVSVNDQVLCNGLPPRGPVVTTMILEHSLFPFRINITTRRGGFSYPEGLAHKATDLNLTCGDSAVSNPLVVRGRPSAAGEWPWLVPIFMAANNGRSVQFQCGGTLVSDRHIVSAAHCFLDNANPHDFVVYVGRRNIRNWADPETQARALKTITLHPDFDRESLYSDLALLELSMPVAWSKTVHPVCLWNGAVTLDLVVGKKATVVGWGTDDAEKTKVTSEPKSVELPIVSQETCLRSSREFYFLSSNRTLCAGARDGSGPCNGDSGGGLYLPVRDPQGNTRWYLRGVVSLSLMDSRTGRCDLSQYMVFSDVAKFGPWLHTVMASSG